MRRVTGENARFAQFLPVKYSSRKGEHMVNDRDTQSQPDMMFSSEGMPTIPLRKPSSGALSWVYGALLIVIGILNVLDVAVIFDLVVAQLAPRWLFVIGAGAVALTFAFVQHRKWLSVVAVVLLLLGVGLPFVAPTNGIILPMMLSFAAVVAFVVVRWYFQSQEQWMLIVSAFALLTAVLMLGAHNELYATRLVLPLLLIVIGGIFLWQLQRK